MGEESTLAEEAQQTPEAVCRGGEVGREGVCVCVYAFLCVPRWLWSVHLCLSKDCSVCVRRCVCRFLTWEGLLRAGLVLRRSTECLSSASWLWGVGGAVTFRFASTYWLADPRGRGGPGWSLIT